MRYLLDTNIFVFMVNDPDLLSRDVQAIVEEFDNVLYISIESLKELIVAYRTKGLCSKVWQTEESMIQSILKSNIQVLPLKPEHMLTYAQMEINDAQGHKDPSDHVIIAQSICEHIPLISSDTRFPYYRKQGLELIENH